MIFKSVGTSSFLYGIGNPHFRKKLGILESFQKDKDDCHLKKRLARMLYAKKKHDNGDNKCKDVPYIQLAGCPSYLKAGYRISDVEF